MLSLKALIYFLGFLGVAQLGASIGYHRFLAHQSFKAKLWFERLIVIAGLPAGTPVQWAGNHRAHHQHADTELDPHSPHFHGFWFAHNGWYLQKHSVLISILYALAGPLRSYFDAIYRPRTNQQYVHLAGDIQSDPFLSWISRPWNYFGCVVIHTTFTLGIAVAWMGWIGLAIAWFCYVWVYNCGDAIDSFSHLYGSRLPGQTHQATNSWWIALITFGEGWHANHHSYPKSARMGFGPRQWDSSFLLLSGLKRIGVIESKFDANHR